MFFASSSRDKIMNHALLNGCMDIGNLHEFHRKILMASDMRTSKSPTSSSISRTEIP